MLTGESVPQMKVGGRERDRRWKGGEREGRRGKGGERREGSVEVKKRRKLLLFLTLHSYCAIDSASSYSLQNMPACRGM